jgi:GTPase
VLKFFLFAGAAAYTPSAQHRTHSAHRRLTNVIVRSPRSFNSGNQQAAVNLAAADATEQAINAAADGDIDAGTATAVGSFTATAAAEYGQRYNTRYTHTTRHWVASGSDDGSRKLMTAVDAAHHTVGSASSTAAQQSVNVGSNVSRRMLAHINRHRDAGVDEQQSISTVAEVTTEQAIDAAADGDVSVRDATFVGSVTARLAAEQAVGYSRGSQRVGVSGPGRKLAMAAT